MSAPEQIGVPARGQWAAAANQCRDSPRNASIHALTQFELMAERIIARASDERLFHSLTHSSLIPVPDRDRFFNVIGKMRLNPIVYFLAVTARGIAALYDRGKILSGLAVANSIEGIFPLVEIFPSRFLSPWIRTPATPFPSSQDLMISWLSHFRPAVFAPTRTTVQERTCI